MSDRDHLVCEVEPELRYVHKLLLIVIDHTDNESALSFRSDGIVQLSDQLNCVISKCCKAFRLAYSDGCLRCIELNEAWQR